MSLPLPLQMTDPVRNALERHQPVVALETAIVTHGMPYPTNLETAQTVCRDIEELGAIPAITAVIEGNIRVGLEPAELERLAQPSAKTMKLSRADLALAVATNRTGGTTVAGTMLIAELAGIEVFATGGIGGVHRGAESDFDISADLYELARSPVTVVAAGAKAILDLPKTLEVLETQGVPVIGFETDEFPAFWSRQSGLDAPCRLDSAMEIARAHRMRQTLGISGGQLIANPIPKPHEITREKLEPLIEVAATEAREKGIAGKAVTPFLLERLGQLTDGQTLNSNIELVRNNARLAAQIAAALCRLKQ